LPLPGASMRRPPSDVFHGDPFKIQSYNFRYADKPVYQVQHYQRPAPAPLVRKPSFQTFYYNPKFNRDPEYTPVNRAPPTSSFIEHRRRRFLQDFKAVPTSNTRCSLLPSPHPEVSRLRSVPVAPQTRRPTPAVYVPCPPTSPAVDIPLLRTCCQRGEYQTMRRGQSTTSLRSSNSNGRGCAGRSASVTTFARASNTQLRAKRSSCSGCEININICGREPESEADNNVSIKIDTDAYMLNNTDKTGEKDRSPQNGTAPVAKPFATSFGIDKRLSKFNVSETKPRTSPAWDRERERQRELEANRERELERERRHQEDLKLERVRELQEERDFMRRREQEREQLRLLERQREREHLLALEAERERQRLRELERETQRHREYDRLVEFQEQLRREREREPMRVMSTPMPMPTPRPMPYPVPMTSHLYAPASDDRLPGMMAFCERVRTPTPERNSSRSPTPVRNASRSPTPVRNASRTSTPTTHRAPNSPRNSTAVRNTTTTRNTDNVRKATPNRCSGSRTRTCTPSRSVTPANSSPRRSGTPTFRGNLERVSSGTSNGNVNVTVDAPENVSQSRLHEAKQLNGSGPFVTRLNNVPIRITTTRTRDRDLDLSMNHVRVRDATMPAPVTVFRRRSGSSQSGQDAYQVNINVYTDSLRMMRI
ncbi:hypothetical protein KR018_007167, partial [Drosophila ironensis]